MALVYNQSFWSEVARFLSAEDLARLYSTLDKSLQVVLRNSGTIRRLTFENRYIEASSSDFVEVALLVRDLSHVENLEILGGALWSPWMMNLTKMPIKSLKISNSMLQLSEKHTEDLRQGIRAIGGLVYGSTNDLHVSPRFEEWFPNLHSLVVDLPWNCSLVEHTSLKNVNNGQDLGLILSHLPPTLQSLTLHRSMEHGAMHRLTAMNQAFPLMPRQLTSLRLSLPNNRNLYQTLLPLLQVQRSLQSLALIHPLSARPQIRQQPETLLGILVNARNEISWPPTLHTLELAQIPQNSPLQISSSIPDLLAAAISARHDLLTVLFAPATNVEAPAFPTTPFTLPTTLTALTLVPAQEDITTYRRQQLERGATLIQPKEGLNLLRWFPRSLTTLDLQHVTVFAPHCLITVFPSQLKRLRLVSPNGPKGVESLGKSLHESGCTQLEVLHFLPHGASKTRNETTQWSLLPASLVELEVDWDLQDDEQLPPKLQTLTAQKMTCGLIKQLVTINQIVCVKSIDPVPSNQDIEDHMAADLRELEVVTTEHLNRSIASYFGPRVTISLVLQRLQSVLGLKTRDLALDPTLSSNEKINFRIDRLQIASWPISLESLLYNCPDKHWFPPSLLAPPPTLTKLSICSPAGSLAVRLPALPLLTELRLLGSTNATINEIAKSKESDACMKLKVLEAPHIEFSMEQIDAMIVPSEMTLLHCHVLTTEEWALALKSRLPKVETFNVTANLMVMSGSLVPRTTTKLLQGDFTALTREALSAVSITLDKRLSVCASGLPPNLAVFALTTREFIDLSMLSKLQDLRLSIDREQGKAQVDVSLLPSSLTYASFCNTIQLNFDAFEAKKSTPKLKLESPQGDSASSSSPSAGATTTAAFASPSTFVSPNTGTGATTVSSSSSSSTSTSVATTTMHFPLLRSLVVENLNVSDVNWFKRHAPRLQQIDLRSLNLRETDVKDFPEVDMLKCLREALPVGGPLKTIGLQRFELAFSDESLGRITRLRIDALPAGSEIQFYYPDLFHFNKCTSLKHAHIANYLLDEILRAPVLETLVYDCECSLHGSFVLASPNMTSMDLPNTKASSPMGVVLPKLPPTMTRLYAPLLLVHSASPAPPPSLTDITVSAPPQRVNDGRVKIVRRNAAKKGSTPPTSPSTSTPPRTTTNRATDANSASSEDVSTSVAQLEADLGEVKVQ